MRKITIPVGSVFGKLKTIGETFSTLAPTGVKLRKALCRCECGTEREVLVGSLLHGQSTSCGCTHAPKSHGCASKKNWPGAYKSWRAMVQRCRERENYGGRGITICDHWKAFANFFKDMGDRPDGYSIERLDVNKGYEPGNCKWIPMSEQPLNTTRTKTYTVRGVTGPICILCRHFGVVHSMVRSRVAKGWTVEAALFTPRLKGGG